MVADFEPPTGTAENFLPSADALSHLFIHFTDTLICSNHLFQRRHLLFLRNCAQGVGYLPFGGSTAWWNYNEGDLADSFPAGHMYRVSALVLSGGERGSA